MNWTLINECMNIIAMFTTVIPIKTILPKFSKTKQTKLMAFYLIFGLILDLITFYIYKVLDQNSYWLTPFYYFNFFVVISLIKFHFSNGILFKKILLLAIGIGVVFLTYRVYSNGLESYDNITWFIIQLYYILLCCFIFYHELKNPKIKPLKNSFFLFASAVFINCFVPLITNLLQHQFYETSPVYFQIALIILNLSTIIANFFFFFAFKHLIPTSTPKPSQLPREPN